MSDENNMFEKNEQSYGGEPVQPEYSQKPQEQQSLGGQNQYTPNSGYAEPVYQQESCSTVPAESIGFGIASMVYGIIALITCCLWCTCIPLAVVSIVLGILQIRKGAAKGMSIAGIVCSAVALVLLIILTVWGAFLQSTGEYNEFLRQLQQLQ